MRTRVDVIFYCWRCGQKISVPETMQDKLMPCPGCERLLTVPPGADVPKRIVQLPDEEEVAMTDNDVSFDCVHCDYLLIADKRGVGMTVNCPACGKPVKVPPPRAAPPKADAAPALSPAEPASVD